MFVSCCLPVSETCMSHSMNPRRHISSQWSVSICIQTRARHHTVLSSLLQSSCRLCISLSLLSCNRPRIVLSCRTSIVELPPFFASIVGPSSAVDEIPCFHPSVDPSVVLASTFTCSPELPRVEPLSVCRPRPRQVLDLSLVLRTQFSVVLLSLS